jgi:beta-fructofuranosidase
MHDEQNYSPKDQYLWDAWFIKTGNDYHMFHLQAPRAVAPAERHHCASIGHAVSQDLMHWEELPAALQAGEAGAWDDLALWTGCVIAHENKFYHFYTGRSAQEFWVQKIGLAVSTDLMHWEKHPRNPLVVADERYYEMADGLNKLEGAPAWRDPYVFRDPASEKFYMTISGRQQSESGVYNGCVAVAESSNLIDWKILPPLLAPPRYEQMETTQMIFHENRYYLFFSTWAKDYEPAWAKAHGAYSGLHCYCADELFGNYQPVNGNGVVLDNGEAMYVVRLLENRGNLFTAIGWLNGEAQGNFIGRLSRPFTIIIDGDRIFQNKGKSCRSIRDYAILRPPSTE